MPALLSKRDALAHALDKSGLNRLLARTGSWNGLLVLNYHRIGDSSGSPFDWGLWSATAESFEQQVAYLARHFDIVGVDDLDNILGQRSGRYVMITFDDGYRDNYEAAFPILKSHAATATFFISTGFLDSPRVAWWDEIAWMVRTSKKTGLGKNIWTIAPVEFDEPNRSAAICSILKTYKSLDGEETKAFVEFLADATGSGRCPAGLADGMWMTWDMLREMRAARMSIGGHTATHPVLSRLSPEDQDREIEVCTGRIATELGERPIAFSYPVGGPNAFDEVTRASLGRHGYRWAFSYYGGYSRFGGHDPFDMPRVAIETDVHSRAFRALTNLPQVFA